ncbi:MAG: hypothetical protein IPO98_02055 [Saprospiraceae bacterium]|nr:hypothetical protein [Saprospiraceae bacterium]
MMLLDGGISSSTNPAGLIPTKYLAPTVREQMRRSTSDILSQASTARTKYCGEYMTDVTTQHSVKR